MWKVNRPDLQKLFSRLFTVAAIHNKSPRTRDEGSSHKMNCQMLGALPALWKRTLRSCIMPRLF